MIAFAVFVGVGNAVRIIVARADLPTVRAVVTTTEPLFRLGGVAAGLGILVGLMPARPFGYTAPWLIGAYLLTALAALLGTMVEAPWARRIAASDEAALDVVRRERVSFVAAVVGLFAWLAILWLMIAKPS